MTGPVVIGYDGGTSGADALTFGLRYAELVGATPIVAVVYPSPAPIGAGRVDAEWVADRRQSATVCVDQARTLAAGSAADFRMVASSSAAHGLSDLVDRERASLIVVGSSAVEGATARIFAGSTASRLLHGATVPVAVAPKGLHERPPAEGLVVGAAYVDTAEAKAALRAAAAFAAAAGAPLRVFTAVAGEADVLPWLIGVDAEQAFTGAAREAFQQAVDAAVADLPPGLEVGTRVLVGEVVEVLAELDVGVLFCGSRGYGPVRSVLLGGVSTRLMRRARSPLVVVPR